MGVAIIDPYTAIQQYDDRVRLLVFRPRVPFNVELLITETHASRPVTKAFLKVAFEERDQVLGKLLKVSCKRGSHAAPSCAVRSLYVLRITFANNSIFA